MRPLIQVQNVRVSYPVHRAAPKLVLGGIDLDIYAGEFLSLVGQTGCGKSTLLRLILGAEQPSSGRILIDGEERNHPDRGRGYVPQRYSLFPDKTVLQNLIFGLDIAEPGLFRRFTPGFRRSKREWESEAHRLLRAMGLAASDGAKYPDQLSGGMQQRVAIAQALLTKPKILLMDEAFSALDPGTRREMQSLILRIWRETGTTILFVTHNTHEAICLGTRVVLLAKEREAGARVAMDLETSDCETPEQINSVVQELECTVGPVPVH